MINFTDCWLGTLIQHVLKMQLSCAKSMVSGIQPMHTHSCTSQCTSTTSHAAGLHIAENMVHFRIGQFQDVSALLLPNLEGQLWACNCFVTFYISQPSLLHVQSAAMPFLSQSFDINTNEDSTADVAQLLQGKWNCTQHSTGGHGTVPRYHLNFIYVSSWLASWNPSFSNFLLYASYTLFWSKYFTCKNIYTQVGLDQWWMHAYKWTHISSTIQHTAHAVHS